MKDAMGVVISYLFIVLGSLVEEERDDERGMLCEPVVRKLFRSHCRVSSQQALVHGSDFHTILVERE
jgi:hypothetical protein